jgi:processive 1,2-diacylglycerol beta-glucosyltransferase
LLAAGTIVAMSGSSVVDLVVVHAPVGGGHKAAAVAVASAARERGLSVELLDVFEHAPRWAGEAYLAAHLAGQNAAPELYGRMYENANRRDGVLEPLRLELDNLVFGALAHRVRELAPRAVVTTHHLPLIVLARARRKRTLAAPVVGVVTDYTSHACWAENGVDLWTVPCLQGAAELAAHGAPRERIAVTGIPVRTAFERIAPLAIHADDDLRVLVTSGGFGATAMTRIVESFAGIPHADLTVVCGAAARLETRVERAARAAGVHANVIGFEHDMASRMASVHVVVGKAGGLTVTETLTAGRPMVIASAVPGNEKANEDHVVRAGAGVTATPDTVGTVAEHLWRQCLLEPMGVRARASVPTGAAGRVVDRALFLASRRSAA